MQPDLRLPASRAASFAVLAPVLATAAGLAACGHGHHDDHGHVPPPAGPPVYEEIEPNDTPATADHIGTVDELTLLYVDGFVEAFGFDVVDHIEFYSPIPAAYDFRVDALTWHGDVDVTIYDPIAQVVVARYFFDGPFEEGRIIVHQPDRLFQVIIEAYLLDTAWSLELVGHPYPGFPRLAGPALGGEGEAPADAAAGSSDSLPDGSPRDAAEGEPSSIPSGERPAIEVVRLDRERAS